MRNVFLKLRHSPPADAGLQFSAGCPNATYRRISFNPAFSRCSFSSPNARPSASVPGLSELHGKVVPFGNCAAFAFRLSHEIELYCASVALDTLPSKTL